MSIPIQEDTFDTTAHFRVQLEGDPITRTYSDLYHVKFAPTDNMHGIKAERLFF